MDAVELGSKNAKWITAIEATNDFTDTFWSKHAPTGLLR
jgi:DMSO/TMAO reductase YedYZ molybdopterin-dependent catalytic subunit